MPYKKNNVALDLEKNGRAIDVKTIAEKDNQLARMSAEVAQKELQCQELSAGESKVPLIS